MKSSSNNLRSNYPEYAVTREVISGYFRPPLPKSTFHDKVQKGIIVPTKEFRGLYYLNASLKRLGLREVVDPPAGRSKRSMEDLTRLAFSLIDEIAFPAPAWSVLEEKLDPCEANHAVMIAEIYRADIQDLRSIEERVAYAAGVYEAMGELAKYGNPFL